MNNGFYWKIAKTNIKNNRKIYFPYILTSIGMVMIFYIVGFLAHDNDIRSKMDGGATLQSLLKFGIWVIAIFAVLFLWYTNSFITKRRKKEFGLFHVLGMGKKNIAHVMLCEGLVTNGVSVVGGLFLGIVFSKLVQGVLYRILRQDLSTLRLSIDTDTLLATILCGRSRSRTQSNCCMARPPGKENRVRTGSLPCWGRSASESATISLSPHRIQ